MAAERENPVALAGPHRVEVKKPGSSFNDLHSTAANRQRQAEHLLRLYGFSFAVALVVAEHAFDNGRRA